METNQNDFIEDMEAKTTEQVSETSGEPEASDSYRFWAEETTSSREAEEGASFSKDVTPASESMADPVVPESFRTFSPFDTAEPPQAPVVPKKKPSAVKKVFSFVALAVCFGAVAGAAFFGIRHAYNHFFPEEKAPLGELFKPSASNQRPNIQLPSTSLTDTGETDASEIVARVVEQTMPAMVSVKTLYVTTSYGFFGQAYTEEHEGGGSGIIIGSNETDLLIATNYHVIEDTTSVQAVLADDSAHNVTVKGSDPAADLAILALPLSSLSEDTLGKIDVAVLGDSDSSKIGQMVIAIGNALGYGPSVTVGYLSAKDREITIEGNDMILLQTNAAINSGNSGGALLNTKGEVIGINNAKLSSMEIEGICFAIPISMATPILDDLMTKEILSDDEKGYLGVSVRDLENELFNWPEGIYVVGVTENGSAEKAGIYQGDLITHVNGKKVTTANQLINEVTSHRYGTTIQITLQRIVDGKFEEISLDVTLQQNPQPSDEK